MKRFLILSISLLFCTLLFSQKKQPLSTTNSDSVLLSTVKYRLVGPFRGGRCGAVCGDPKQRTTFYMGSTGGGVWKTIDGGSNWKNISDKYFGGSIGSIALAPSDPTIIYVGEGESTLRGNVSEGFGIWRSDDAGRTWKNMGLKDTRHIVRIVVHPKDPNTVWVAAIGHLFGPNDERGVYKTTNGGKTWRKVLFSDNQSGAVELVMEPGNPNTLYASTWTCMRTPYSFESGGKGSALWKSTDGGETWQNLNSKKGFPSKSVIGIIGIAVAPSNPEKVYAIVENEKGGLLCSEDGGETWNLKNSENNIRQRAWYYSKLFVDPKNSDKLYVLNVNFLKSVDGGKTFSVLNTPHGDHHDLWIDPEEGNRMIIGDDGGAQISYDGGYNWSTYYNQPTAQFYRVSTDNYFPYRILGAQQDNSTVRTLSQSNGGGITQSDWTPTAGFESGYVVADPLNPDVVYGGNYGGYLARLDHKTNENRDISIWPDSPIGAGADVQKYRFQWNFPIFFSPHNPKKLYAAGNVLFSTENEGATWTPLGGDLTTNDKVKQKASGGPITKDNTGVEVYCTIFTATESSLEKDVLWAGSDDGLIHVSKDGGQSWQNVTPPAAGKWMMWNCVETDPFKKGKAYFAGTKYKSDDYTPYLFKTEDYGKTWQLITSGIDPVHFTRCIRADKKREGLLYCGTEYGMYISYDGGNKWKPFQLNLPKVPITDLTIKENDLVIATQGRSFWVLNLNVVQQMENSIAQKNLHLFDIDPAYPYGGSQNLKVTNAGINPPIGNVMNYFIKDLKDSAEVIIVIKDKNKKTIKKFSTKGSGDIGKIEAKSGMNVFVWDMKYPPAEKIEGMILWNGTPGGPNGAPGNYFCSIKVGKDSTEKAFEIKAIPIYKCSQQDYEEQFEFLITVRDKFSEIQKTIKNIRDLRKQINEFVAKQGKDVPKEIKQLSDTINKQMTAVEEALYQTKAKSEQDVLNFPIRLNDKIAGLWNYAASGNYAPTKQVKETYIDLAAKADVEMAKFKNTLESDVSKLNSLIREKALPVIGLKPEEEKK